jgi:predicted dehydrogenase
MQTGGIRTVIEVGIVGAGYWGPKHIRNFTELPGAHVAMVADLSEARLSAIRNQYPDARTTTDFQELLAVPNVDAVVIATPVSTHADLAAAALCAGKHVLVEKPLAASTQDCQRLIRIAAERDRVLMVGHTFLYNPAVLMLRDMVEAGTLGDVYYAHTQRLNLGLFQRDINVLWDLAPHDLSILMYVLGSAPVAIAARGHAHVRAGIEDNAYMDLAFPNDVNASVHTSWLDPNKVRRITLVGSKKMVVYDDVETLEKIRVYDKGVDVPSRTEQFGEFQLSYRYGDISIPSVPGHEPLRLECEHFLECITTGATPRTDGLQGLKVVQALEIAGVSLANGGTMVPMSTLNGTGNPSATRELSSVSAA